MSHFIDIGPDCWSRRAFITEARTKRDESSSMDELLKNAILNNFKSGRSRIHKGIRRDSERYQNRRISKERAELGLGNRWDSVAATNNYTNEVVDSIFELIPQLKGSGAFTGYVRYSLTNRWPNRFHFNKRDLFKLEEATKNKNTELQTQVLNYLIKKGKINNIAKEKFLSYDTDKQLRNIEAWKNQKAITNTLYNKTNAEKFLQANESEKLNILKDWANNTLVTTDPSTFIVRYCNNMQLVNDMIADAHQVNSKISDDSIDKRLKSGEYERDANLDGVTDEDRAMVRNIFNTIHDTRKDLRDYTPEELDDQERRWQALFKNDEEIDWNAPDEDE